MKAESTIRPIAPFEVEILGSEKCIVRFFENVEELPHTDEESTKYHYDEYILELHYRVGIESTIETSYDAWLQCAKDKAYNATSEKVRNERDELLAQTDKYVLVDYPISAEDKVRVVAYREALRDITETTDFPFNVHFPVLDLQ